MAKKPEKTPVDSETMVTAPPKKRLLLRILSRFLIIIAVFIIFAIGLRLYFSNERLRIMTEQYLATKLQAPISIKELDVSLFSGVEIDDITIGPPPNFTLTSLSCDKIALHWSLWQLARLRLNVTELAIKNLHVALEENENGSSLTALLNKSQSESVPKNTPEKQNNDANNTNDKKIAPAAKKSGLDISLPIHVEIEQIKIANISLETKKPGEKAYIDQINAEGHFSGKEKDLNLDFWFGLGERNPDGLAAKLKFFREKPAADLNTNLRLGIHLTTAGLKETKIDIKLTSQTNIAAPYILPTLDTAWQANIAANLQAGLVKLQSCILQIGQQTRLSINGSANDIMSASPNLNLQQFKLFLDLDELNPIVSAIITDKKFSGRITFNIAAFSTDLQALINRSLPNLNLSIDFNQVALSYPGTDINSLNGTTIVNTIDDLLNFTADLQINKLALTAATSEQLKIHINGTSPLAPYLGAKKIGSVQTHIDLELLKATTPTAKVSGLQLTLDLMLPIAMLLAKSNQTPLNLKMQLATHYIATKNNGANGIKLNLTADSWDLAAKHLLADVNLKIREVWAKQKQANVSLPGFSLNLLAERQNDNYNLKNLKLELGKLIKLQSQGHIYAATSRTPVLNKFKLAMQIPTIESITAALPESLLPKVKISGNFELAVDANGSFPLDKFQSYIKPPKIIDANDQDPWRAMVLAYTEFAGLWTTWFERGLPGTANLNIKLANAHIVDNKNEIHGLDLNFNFELGLHGPHLHLAADVDQVKQPTPVQTGHFAFDWFINGATSSVKINASAQTLMQKPLTKALTNLNFDFASRYRLGGDAILEQLRLIEDNHGLKVDISGVVTKPLAIALERGWQQPKMPGVDANLRFDVNFGKTNNFSQITLNGPSLDGMVGIDGAIRVTDGVIALSGQLKTNQFSYAAGNTAVEQMHGTLPFNIELLAGRRNDAVVIAQPKNFGGGLLSLRVADAENSALIERSPYYHRLRAYNPKRGLTILALRNGPYEIDNLRLDGKITAGSLIADWISLSVLGGDIVGNMAFKISSDASLGGNLAFQISAIDASNFKLLNLTPGEDSELNLDLRLGFLFAPRKRDLTMDVNITKIGGSTLDRFLQLLDPQGQDAQLQSTRKNLRWVSINEVALWVRYENLNMDIAYSTKIRIPFTQIGYHPIPRELLRRYSLSELLNAYLQPTIDAKLAPALGWTYVH
ncbi:MAG: hypothetical protein JW841_00805 [Deltaproteobacteria bacterium]|nr:hypothetical protein [Deltaproteobacteria bacterium]